MAGVSTKQIKNRIRSMESTKQITKAMEMVAASKLRRAQARVLNSRPYFEILSAAIRNIARDGGDASSVYFREVPEGKTLHIVIAGDRGLAGGYNSNILKPLMARAREEDLVLPIGKKALDYVSGKGMPLFLDSCREAGEMGVGECFSVARQIVNGFLAGDYTRVLLDYTQFQSVLSQVPQSMQLLPLTVSADEEPHSKMDTLYEGDRDEVFARIVPEYLGGVLYGALCESQASEQAARRAAMDSATQNADEMIADLSLKFNRARQAAITQEITEIVAGS